MLAELDVRQGLGMVVDADFESHLRSDLSDLGLAVADTGMGAEDQGVVAVAEETQLRDLATELRAVVVHDGTIPGACVEVARLAILAKRVHRLTR